MENEGHVESWAAFCGFLVQTWLLPHLQPLQSIVDLDWLTERQHESKLESFFRKAWQLQTRVCRGMEDVKTDGLGRVATYGL